MSTTSLKDFLGIGYAGFTGSQGITSTPFIVSSNYNALDQDFIIADTTLNSFTITLPANPIEGVGVKIATIAASTNNVTINGNGNTLEGLQPTLVIDIDNVTLEIIYSGTTWQVYVNIGQNGFTGSTGPEGFTGSQSVIENTFVRETYIATEGQTIFAVVYDIGFVDVYLNGVRLVLGTDFTATNNTSITLTTPASAGDVVDIVAFGEFILTEVFNKTESDARFVKVTENLSDLDDSAVARTNLGLVIGTDVQAFDADTVKTTATQTLTNKTISGDSNTILNISRIFNPTVAGSGEITDWTGSDPSTATVTVPGILATDVPIVDIDLSAVSFANIPTTQADWALVYRVETPADNQLKLYATAEPTQSFALTVKVVR